MVSTETRIGILGGSFDPIHQGHLAIAQLALEHFKLADVFFIPAHIPPHKSNTVSASAHHRLAMLKKAIIHIPEFKIWEGEMIRGGVSFTIHTLQTFKKNHPHAQLYFIIGSDNLMEMLSWHQYKSIISLVTLCVTHRPGYAMRVPEELATARIVRFPSPEWGISSTMVRHYLGKKKLSAKYLIPQSVLTYIEHHGLYQ